MSKLQAIAIHLPQFHPITENDEWWGKGFTEWTNVTKAQPLFKNHYQPHLPADLGFYDLRLAEARLAQEAMAKQYGITGFCYYHYWFNGHRLLEKPVDAKLANQAEDLPFMLCWANENWSRRWDGLDQDMLMQQNYSADDDATHIRHLLTFFKDNRYIKIDGKPVFAVYKSTELPNAKATTDLWRKIAREEAGMELYLVRFEAGGNHGEKLMIDGGFDAAIDFQPLNDMVRAFQAERKKKYRYKATWWKDLFVSKVIKHISRKKYEEFKYVLHHRLSYPDYVKHVLQTPQVSYKRFPGISPGWDNTARKKNRHFLFYDSTPELYRTWFAYVAEQAKKLPSNERFIFINAWNEWAEGNHLEPCQKWGRAYLEATKEVLEKTNNGIV